jgi:two-component system, NtrC family, nitrogen regulation sensor histidine kinase GlnL
MQALSYCGLDSLTTAVLLLREDLSVLYANPAAENLLEQSRKSLISLPLSQVLAGVESLAALANSARANHSSFVEHQLSLGLPGRPVLQLRCRLSPVQLGEASLLLELLQINEQLRIAREERIVHEQRLNRELIRNLAHEIRNPLGGIRGAAQLLEHELERRDLREYTQVIRHEADRLQGLMDRLLTPNRLPTAGSINIHEVLERVRSLILAEYPHGVTIRRDYDTSLPELHGYKEQLIQAVLNVARNAAQAMQGRGEILFRSRLARSIPIAKKRFRMALRVEIVDNGPGIPSGLQDKIFYPLVSGREGGSGLGLALAQNHILEHQGIIEFESAPGNTRFILLLPVPGSEY